MQKIKNRVTAKAFTLLAVVLVTAIRTTLSQESPMSASKPSIVVRVLNGKNGKAITKEELNVYFESDKKHPQLLPTDPKGEIRINTDGISKIGLKGNYYVDCRHMTLLALLEDRYSIDQIRSVGVVTENSCGKHHAPATPGVLVLYLRPMTFMERWRE